MKTKFISIILLGASLGLGSCSDYLDMTPTDKASDKLVWSKLEYAEQAVNDFYRYIDYLGVYRDGQCLAGMTEALTDQLKYGSYNYMSKCQINRLWRIRSDSKLCQHLFRQLGDDV